jgi:hypothetical protein
MASKVIIQSVTDTINLIIGLALLAGDFAKLKYNMSNTVLPMQYLFSYLF